MPRFRYRAVDRNGDVTEGELDALDSQAVIHILQRRGYTPLGASAATDKGGLARRVALWRRKRGISVHELAVVTEELATLVLAGVELDRALGIAKEAVDGDALKQLLTFIQTEIREGRSLSQALSARNGIFSREYVSVVRAGESAGILGPVLRELAEHLEREVELRETIVSALFYPIVLLSASVLSLVFIFGFVLPRFEQLFNDMHAPLPILTQSVIVIGEAVRRAWWGAGLGLAVIGAFLYRRAREPWVLRRVHGWVLRWPVLGAWIRDIHTARFTSTLSMLTKNAIPLPTAMQIAREGLSNTLITEQIAEASEMLTKGARLADALAKTKALPTHAVHMVRVGESAGELPRMLDKVASAYGQRVRMRMERALALLGPAVIIGLAGVIAVIVLSLVLAILGLNDLAL